MRMVQDNNNNSNKNSESNGSSDVMSNGTDRYINSNTGGGAINNCNNDGNIHIGV